MYFYFMPSVYLLSDFSSIILTFVECHSHYVFSHGPLTRGRRGTGLAGSVPGFAHVIGAAAHLLGHVEGELVLAGVVEVAVTHTLSHICETERRG